ncbi:MAG: selenocysteine-specific translation elongation factor, partial [Vulcanimicrobiota bacterium]
MSDYILGTAGHVDHGKTTLIKALTGIDADRLPQEKERGLTLDLGFANIQLPSGRVCSIVDVPGHEKYLKNMLAGVGGFDFALLIIDASEGIMPQTIEHFEILKLLNIQDGLPVITKADLVSAQEIEKLKTQLKDFIRDSFLEKSPAMTVSAVSGQGIEELKSEIDNRLEQLTPRDLSLPGRLAIDRVFVKPGFGVVVTGSMFQGSFELYQKVVVLPSTQKAKIRKIQFQGEDVKEARAGQRIALNLGGVDSAVIKRGNQVTASGTLFNTVEFDAKIKVLDSSPHPLKHRDEIRLYITTDEVFGKVFLLDRSELEPGETGFVRIMLD